MRRYNLMVGLCVQKGKIDNIMKTFARAVSMQSQALSWRADGRKIALVPTMGALHAGHAGLVLRARKEVGQEGRVVVSVFVNPAQFSPKEGFADYPRSEKADRELCRRTGADALFLPRTTQEIYPGKTIPYSTFVSEERLSRSMEGQFRPGHFRGVATVVLILLNIVQPTHTVFGEKDFQQAAVVRKMIRDLRFPVKFVLCPTVREKDGLACSSRNVGLDEGQRSAANVLWRCIVEARKIVRQSGSAGSISTVALKCRLTRMIAETPGAKLDYLEIFNPQTLAPLRRGRRNDRIALAVRFGKIRLLDNGKL